ncbi:tail fiber protein [Pseudaminobacter sp. 19-2017]|uniref:Tail fiber protein n=1 Tax=Pseudaminobacter soli (ex Zhang et al. 2022) TaxID=2831468 RepID=A0A942I3H5_9HYPH|nr:tail fiber protein [Pseudaminobacter soli]MBS3651302.1 tail fiber protein [Pseudaminobacter soli]
MIKGERAPIAWALDTGIGRGLAQAVVNRRLLDWLGGVFFAFVCLFIAAYALVKPDYNWDMVAYVATALEDRYQDSADLHAATWKVISESAPEAQLYEIQYGNPYNKHQWENPADFQSQLSMYRVKVGYVWLMRAMEPVVGLANAAILLSVIPSLLVGALMLYWLARENALQAGFILAPLLMLADQAQMTSAVVPDMLLSLVSLAALYAFVRGREALACVLLFASVFVRPDNLILIFALLLTAVIFGWRVLPMLATFLASLLACVAISKYGGHPGWWAHFYFSCVKIQNSMAGFQPDFSPVAMLQGYMRGVVVSLIHNDWAALLALFVAGWALLNRYGRAVSSRQNALLFALVIGTIGKFASFPLPDDRFYHVFILGMAVLLVTIWKPRFDAAFSVNIIRSK